MLKADDFSDLHLNFEHGVRAGFFDLGTTFGLFSCVLSAYNGNQLCHDKRLIEGCLGTRDSAEKVFERWYIELRDNHPCYGVVCYEDVVRWSSSSAAKRYCGLLAILQAHCSMNNIPLLGFKPKSGKLALAGRGNASKGEMIEAANKITIRTDFNDHLLRPLPQPEKMTDNMADALGIYCALVDATSAPLQDIRIG